VTSVIIFFCTGLLFIIYRNKIALYLEKLIKFFPKYKEGEDLFKPTYTVRPFFFIILGLIYILMGFRALFSLL